MSDPSASCLSRDQLEHLAAGQEVSAADRAHVAECDLCREILQQIHDDNAFLAGFRSDDGWPHIEAPDETTALVIPGYDICEEIKRGGQGVVFKAIQHSTQRPVAIKVMRQDIFTTTADRARFTREIETLGRLKHPHIVAVHDAGFSSGSHYFVMDYIEGMPLDEAVEAWRHSGAPPTLSGDLGLRMARSGRPAWLLAAIHTVIEVCDAVHAAHLRGVMHRDIKPSNIRVDAGGKPHVLDFGLAKSVDDADTEMTQAGQFVGSLPWASPEQVEGAAARIDLRTDIYSIGAVLFQLLTGRVPFEVESSLRDALDNIVLRDPPRPSSIVTQHNLRIDADLDAIVLKCLEKDRAHRYQSAGDLAAELQRYLGGDAILARSDSTWYFLRKAAWKRRRILLAAVIPLLLLAVTGYAVISGRTAARRADQEQSLRQVESMRNAAMLEITRRMNARPGSTEESPGGRLSRVNADSILADLDTGSLSVSDHGAARLLAETLRDRGLYVVAEGLVRRAIYMLSRDDGPTHPDIGRMRVLLADLLLRRGRLTEAAQNAELAVDELTSAFGKTASETSSGWNTLARIRLATDDSQGALTAVLAAIAADADTSSIRHVQALATLACVHAALGNRSDADRHAREALRSMLLLAHDTDARLLDTIRVVGDLAAQGIIVTDKLLDASELTGPLAEMSPAEALIETSDVLRGGADGTPRDLSIIPARMVVVHLRERMLGREHDSLGASLAATAVAEFADMLRDNHYDRDELRGLIAMLERAIPLQINLHGADSPLVGKSCELIATCHSELRHPHEATNWFEKDCLLWIRQPPGLRDEYQIMLRARWTAWHAVRAGEFERSLPWIDRAMKLVGQVVGVDHPGAALLHACRARAMAELGFGPEAIASVADTLHILETRQVPEDQRIDCERYTALACARLGDLSRAQQLIDSSWRRTQDQFAIRSPFFRAESLHIMYSYYSIVGDVEHASKFRTMLIDEDFADMLPDTVSTQPAVP